MDVTITEKPHLDGGTYRVLAFHETRNHWGVAITRWLTYRGNVVFEVHRVDPNNVMMPLTTHSTEDAARAAANKLWVRDTTA